MNKASILKFFKRHKDLIAIFVILFVCYFLYFFSMGSYPLIDVDETRYVAMSRDLFHANDLLTLYLNGDYFFEKPPLYFWLEVLSFSIFGKITEATARIPVALCAVFGVGITYFLGSKISSKKYGLICALILASCFEYVVLARVAILDMLLSVCIAASAFSGIYTLFCSHRFKKYFWWLAYIWAGFAVMAKGVPGLAIPALTIFISYIIAGRFKEMFKPLYIIPGLVLFFIVTLPWHIIMLQKYGYVFFREYIYKHHFERFANSHELGRKQPFYYYIPVFFLGFMPWIFSFGAQITVFFKKHFKNIQGYFDKFCDLQPLHKFMVLNTVFFLVVFGFYSAASTKLPTYILPAMFPAAMILGKFWFDYIFKDENERAVNISTIILNFAFILTAIGLTVVPQFIREADRAGLEAMQIPGVIVIMASVLFNSFAIFKDKKKLHFIALVGFMAVLSMFAAKMIFPYVVSFGQNELIEYAKTAKNKGAKLAAMGTGNRYSLIYYAESQIDFIKDFKIDNNALDKGTYVIVRNKNVKDFNNLYNYEIIKQGKKYSLYNNAIPKTKK